jgi:hypothetical protein
VWQHSFVKSLAEEIMMGSLLSRFCLFGVALGISGWVHAEPVQSTTQGANLTRISSTQAVATVGPVGLTTTNTYSPLLDTMNGIRVTPIPESWRVEFGIDPFYTKGVMVRGMPILSSDKASDYALLECAYLLDHMFASSPPWVQAAMSKAKTRMSVMSVAEYTMDLPENLVWQSDRSPEKMAFWDKRARGMGGLPDASCAEENLLNLSSDPYKSENITLHEFSHTTASALQQADPAWYGRLETAYKNAMAAGRFVGSYAANNEQEYWAEGAQDWFDCNSKAKDSIHNGIWNRDQLKKYDPELAKLLTEVFGDGPWRYLRTDGKTEEVNGQIYARSAADTAHLEGLDRVHFPAFDFSKSPRIQAFKASATPVEKPTQQK